MRRLGWVRDLSSAVLLGIVGGWMVAKILSGGAAVFMAVLFQTLGRPAVPTWGWVICSLVHAVVFLSILRSYLIVGVLYARLSIDDPSREDPSIAERFCAAMKRHKPPRVFSPEVWWKAWERLRCVGPGNGISRG